MLNKKSNLSYKQVRDRHEHFRARCISVKVGKAIAKNKTRKKKEDGCVEPLYKGKKAKCIIKIVPKDKKVKTFQMDKKCIKTRENNI